jgi:hypothetical protein
MRKGLFIILTLLFGVSFVEAQNVDGARLPARANVVPYDDEDAIVKNAYRESPYYMELTGRWDQKQTDSSRVYSREIEVEKYWKDYRVTLNVRCGYGCRIYLNDKVVGMGDDSRHRNEFDLNDFLKYGKKNVLKIEALKHPVGALLECENREVGLNGEPFLLFKSDPNIEDFSLVADYDAATATGSLMVDATLFNSKKKGRYYLEVEIWDPQNHSFDRMGRWVVFDKKNEMTVDMSRSWANVVPWSAETPNLYTVVLRLHDENMDEEEVVGTRFGFRRVEVRDGLLQVNGRPITLKGVIYQQEIVGDHSSRENLRAMLQSFKRNNINAVRCSLSPQAPCFYELCDELGLYVVCDANLFPASSQQRAVATDKEFIPLFQRRVENLYGKYKNYTSIIAWSLGDTRDNGICMGAAYKRLKDIDKHRPVIFSGADFSANTDIVAFLNPNQQHLRQATSKVGDRPFLILSAPIDGYDRLWQRVENLRTLQGAFANGNTKGYPELKDLYSPFDVHIMKRTGDDVEFTVYNRNDFADFSNYILEYTIYTNLRSSISGGDLPVAIEGGGVESVKLRIPPVKLESGEELFVRFDLSQRQKGRVVTTSNIGTVAFSLDEKNSQRKPFVNAGTAALDVDTGSTPVFKLLKLQFTGHEDWVAEKVAVSQRTPDKNTVCVDAMMQYLAAGTPMCYARVTYTFFATGDVVVDYTLSPTDAFRGSLSPQLVFKAPQQDANDSLVWFGLDRESRFSERAFGVPGIYRKSRSEMNGTTRQQVRWCVLRRGGNGLYFALLDHPCTIGLYNDGLYFSPVTDSRSFRLHMREHGNAEHPETFYAIEMPVVKTGIVEPPKIVASEIRFSQPLTITIASPVKGEIRYTLDGSEPTETSMLYTKPFELTTTTVVKARVYVKDMPPSFTATRKFNYDYIISTTFSRKPNTPFNVGTDTILFDGEKGLVSDLQRGWLGFSGSDVTATIMLSKRIDIENITLRFAHVPDNWAFAPKQVTVLLSTDGEHYTDTLKVAMPFDPASSEENSPREVEVKVPVTKGGVAAFKVEVAALSAVPAWHRAKGLKPWILMDEIEVSERIKENKN